MDILRASWHYGFPILLVISAAAMVVATLTERMPSKPLFDGARWFFLLFPLMWAGDALAGTNRPVFERATKGAAAALFAVAVVIDVVRRRRHRRRTRSPRCERTFAVPGRAVMFHDLLRRGRAGQWWCITAWPRPLEIR